MGCTFVPSLALSQTTTIISNARFARHASRRRTFSSRRPLRALVTARSDESLEAIAVAVPVAAQSAFGRGAQFPRRMVGLYELEREGIDLGVLLAKDTRDQAAFAGVVGFFVLSIVVFPLVTPGPALEGALSAVAAFLLTVWAVDALALGGVLGRATSLALQNRRRVACHEAGHFLVGFLLGFDIEGYQLPSPKAVLRNEDEVPGVRFGECRVSGDAHCVSAVGMAGIASEVIKYGTSEGGAEDMADVSRGIKACYGGRQVQDATMKGTVRWGLIESIQLLRDHAQAHDNLCEAMLAGSTTEQCMAVIESSVNREKLEDKPHLRA